MKSIKEMPWECGKGWWPLIEKVASAIDSFNAAHPDSPVEVSQIKQKFGGLRIYHYNASERRHRRRHYKPGRLQTHPMHGMPKGNQAEGYNKT